MADDPDTTAGHDDNSIDVDEVKHHIESGLPTVCQRKPLHPAAASGATGLEGRRAVC